MSTITVAGRSATRPEWLAERRKSIGASDAPIVLGLAGSRLKLWLEKVGLLEDDDEPTEEMLTGLDMEPVIAKHYERRTGRRIVALQRFLRHPERSWCSATIDGVTDEGRTVEFKMCGVHSPEGRELGDDGESETLPYKWIIQVNQQLAVGGASRETDGKTADVAVWIDNRLRVFPIERHDGLIEIIGSDIGEFWNSFVLPRIPPAEIVADDARTLTRAFRRNEGDWLLLGHQETEAAFCYKRLGEEINGLQKERDAAKARLLLSLGNAAGADLDQGWSVERKVVRVEHKAREAYEDQQVRIYVKEPR